MYDELVKSLRQCAEASCAGCKNDLVQIGCRGLLQHEAADAIEELAAFKAQITDGRFYVARDGVLYELKNDPRTIRISSPEFIGPPKEE